MDSKEILTLEDGHPDVWKVQEGETPSEALERFFKAFDESLPASERPVSIEAVTAVVRATRENKAELADLKTKLADSKIKLADLKNKLDNLNRQIEEKELEGGRLRIQVDAWSSLCAAKVCVAKEWKDAGVIADHEFGLIITKLWGMGDIELWIAIEARLKEKGVIKEKATEENGENYEPPACTSGTDMIGPTTPILAGSEQQGDSLQAKRTDGQ